MKYLIAILSVSVIAITGCNATGGGVRTDEPLQRSAPLKMNSVIFVDHSLNRTVIDSFDDKITTVKVSVQRKGVRSTPTGSMEVWAVLRNHTDYPLQVQAKTSFFDSQEAPAENASAWQRVHLQPNSTATYKEAATSTTAAYYVIEVQEGR